MTRGRTHTNATELRRLHNEARPQLLARQIKDAGLPIPISKHFGSESEQMVRKVEADEPLVANVGAARMWRFDFYYPEYKIAVEYEGGAVEDPKPWQKIRSDHVGPRLRSDAEKYNVAQIRGVMLIRILPSMVNDGSAPKHVKAALLARGWRPPGRPEKPG